MRYAGKVSDSLGAAGTLPNSVTVVNGPDLSRRKLDLWAYERGVKLDFIRTWKGLTENGLVKSFNGRLRDALLNT